MVLSKLYQCDTNKNLSLVLISAGALISGYSIYKVWYKWEKNRKLRSIVMRKRREREAGIDELQNRLTELTQHEMPRMRKVSIKKHPVEIRRLSMDKLIEGLQHDTYTPVEVVHAYQQAALLAHARTNCVTEFLLEAEEEATKLQEQYRGKPNKPPLYGVPFSVKACFQVAGHEPCIGFVQDLGIPAENDCVLVKALRELGAIPITITNIPQSMLSYTCRNPVFGQTTNPYERDRTCGGSSGGEGALIALGGAMFGLGTDVAGSIRMPAHFCGLAGLKPSHLRLSLIGLKPAIPGRQMIQSSDGPMAPNVDTLVTFCRHLFTNTMYKNDPYLPPLGFDEQLFNSDQPLNVGFYIYDGWMDVVPSCARAVEEAKIALENRGHHLIAFNPPDVSEVIRCGFASLMTDQGQHLLKMVDADIVEPYHKDFYDLYRIPVWLRRLFAKLLPARPRLFRHWLTAKDTSELRTIYVSIAQYRQQFFTAWTEAGIDCILCPALFTAALPHDYPMPLLPAVSHTMLYNILDYPAGVVPCTSVTIEDEAKCEQEYPIKDNYSELTKKANSFGSCGLPVGVQCVALPYREEICLRLMKEVENGLKS